MGCDVHILLEKRLRVGSHDPNYWDSFGFYPLNPGRDYEKFGKLAGVRDSDQPHIEPRGFPDPSSFAAKSSYWLLITTNASGSEGCCSPFDATNWVASGLSVYSPDGKGVSHPDQHTHTYLSLEEWKKALEPFEPSPWDADWKALTAAAESLNESHEVRFLIWFDN